MFFGLNWGENSKGLTEENSLITVFEGNTYSCFNLLFYTPTLSPLDSFSLDVGYAFGFDKEKLIYFEPTRVKYLQTH